jgi:hypothetical protein
MNNGTSTKAVELNELYDQLSSDSRQIWDDIGLMGYKPDKTDAGWSAVKIAGSSTVGPCESLVALYNEVKVIHAGTVSQSDNEAVADNDTPPKLSLGDATRYSELKQLGWKVDGAGKEWFASELEGEQRKIGPATSVKALHTQVMLAAGPPRNTAKPAGDVEDGEPSSRLPGMEEPAIEELDRLGDDCIDTKEARDKAKTAFDDKCDIMRQKMREHGRKRYNRRGFSLVIEDTEKLVIKKAENVKAPKNPKAPKVIKPDA